MTTTLFSSSSILRYQRLFHRPPQYTRYASTASSSVSATTPTPAASIPKVTKKGNTATTNNKIESLRGNNQLVSLLKYNPSSSSSSSSTVVNRSHQQIMEPLPTTVTKGWTPQSVRTGLVGIKAGMTTDWDSWGVRKTLTVIKVSCLRKFFYQ